MCELTEDFLFTDAKTAGPAETFESQARSLRRHGLFDLARLYDEIAIRKRQGLPVNPGQMPGIEGEALADGNVVDEVTGEVYEAAECSRATWQALMEFCDLHPDGTSLEAMEHVRFRLGEQCLPTAA